MGRILIIDDDTDLSTLISAHLSHAGHSVSHAENGREGVAQAEASPPDLIILDINMPVMDGTKVMKALRGTPAAANVPVIALSALSHPEMRDDMHGLGCKAYIVKPVDIPTLLKTVDNALSGGTK